MSRKQPLKQSEEDEEEQKKRKSYLRKLGLRKRYGDVCEKTIDRYRKKGRIPKPDFYIGPIPFCLMNALMKPTARQRRNH